MNELKPCPFCGGAKLKIERKSRLAGWNGLNVRVEMHTFSVRCNTCHARGGAVGGRVMNDLWTRCAQFPDWATTDENLEEKQSKHGTGGLTMPDYIKLGDAIAIIEEQQKELCPVGRYGRGYVYGSDREKYDAWDKIIDALENIPAAEVAPIEALERLRDELYAQALITMEGLRKLNTLIWKYTTVHDGRRDKDV